MCRGMLAGIACNIYSSFEIEHDRILTPCNVDYLPEVALVHSVKQKKDGKTYMLFAGWEVRVMKNCDRGLEPIRLQDSSPSPLGKKHKAVIFIEF